MSRIDQNTISQNQIDLSGTWQVTGAGKQVPMHIPGDVHSALLTAGEIDDPYWGTNELDLQHLHAEDFTLSRSVEVTQEFLSAPAVYIHFDSIDTVGEVFVNGTKVGSSDNMFARCRFDVTQTLVEGSNQIEVRIRSAEQVAIDRVSEMPYEIPGSDFPVQSPHRNLVRKVQCHAGWDWGCCLMAVGLYGKTYLASASDGRIEHVYTTQHHDGARCSVDVCIEIQAEVAGTTPLRIDLADQHVEIDVELVAGDNVIHQTLQITDPKLWWPAGYGEQPLYDLHVSACGETVHRRLGLRELELIAEEDDRGLGFRFRVNGIDIFAKGANWIPCDALPSRQTRDALDELLSSAAQAHMNMIRVWGGGQYESDDFYELCDEKGLLIWQDFMFSCSTYPATKDFLASVEVEARYQVKRLRDHACIALWCGNNEDLGALTWYDVSKANRDRYVVDYDRLTEGVLGRVVDECDPTRTFWPSSPSGGRGDYSDNWHDDSRGDMHYWQVWHSGMSFDAFYDVTPRFCSEFGYQSFPSLETIRTYAPEDQFNVTAPVMEHHQRNPGGNSKITEMFTRYFRMPEGFGNFVYLSQVQQGLAIKTAVEHWRHLRPICMGTLYWQLNDLWPVCSWSSLEYGGKWKLLHYMAKRFYSPTIVSAFQTRDDKLEVWVTNDRTESLDAKVTLRLLDFTGVLIRQLDFSEQVEAGSAVNLGTYAVDELAPDRTCAFAVLDLQTTHGTFRNEHVFTAWKACELPVAQVTTAVEAMDDGRFTVSLETDAPVFYLSLDAEGIRGEFDDNCFTLLPGEDRQVVFTPKDAPGQAILTVDEFEQQTSIQHLRTTYH
ncbi:MAG: glycoside hydrolase family 2 protein [Gemmatimonadetes bacterium]|jgi:beta-mannosidase|nr:glycoside hydrolase family 2 protein [Gemmatimonadota bacterium]MBT7860708.1 glycoside hydrolase family 2 protein [Gemmatimonadota bacterium]